MMMVLASVAVAIVSFILYALERRSKQEPIAWDQAAKVTLVSGLLTSGVVFATTAEVPVVAETVKAVAAEAAPAVQDMFVGTPTF
jgi:hypothetical protein